MKKNYYSLMRTVPKIPCHYRPISENHTVCLPRDQAMSSPEGVCQQSILEGVKNTSDIFLFTIYFLFFV